MMDATIVSCLLYRLQPDLTSVLCFAFPDLDDPIVTVHQSIGEAKEQFYYERTVFLRCVANSNPPVRYSWRRGQEVLLQGSDKGVEIYEPFFTQVGACTEALQLGTCSSSVRTSLLGEGWAQPGTFTLSCFTACSWKRYFLIVDKEMRRQEAAGRRTVSVICP